MTYKEHLEGFIGRRGATKSGAFWVGAEGEGGGASELAAVHDDFVVINEYAAGGAYERSWAVPLASFWITYEEAPSS